MTLIYDCIYNNNKIKDIYIPIKQFPARCQLID